MAISASISSVTLFTLWNKDYGCVPLVHIGAEQISQDNNPKLPGFIFDNTWTFNVHASYTVRKAGSRLNGLRALSDTLFGYDKECLKLTLKALMHPFFDYVRGADCPPKLFSSPSPTCSEQVPSLDHRRPIFFIR